VTQTWSKEQQVSKGGWEEETVSLRYYTVQEEAFEKGIRSVIDYLFQTRKDKNILVTERYKNTLVTGMLSRCRPRSTTQELFTYSHVECFCSLFECGDVYLPFSSDSHPSQLLYVKSIHNY